ncbi:hypothetical protein LCGC14_1538500 [marine sediment metagenome]|uniref:Enoyl reductase (ER) domain-containing protein n=1 Tax=marine sediment metagenome TaxID=412755 RepID=A0A0F9IU04_9ZZZZ
MYQQIMTAPGKIEFQEIPVPKFNENEVLVKIMRIGICGSDIHVYHGEHPYTQYPITQGHEVSGKIEKIGSKVQGFNLNEKVTIQPQVVCKQCFQCTHGRYHICDDLKVMGFQTTGAGSEFFAVNSEKLIKLPWEMTYEQGAMIEPCAVGVHAVLKGGDISRFNVLVLGAGPIGNLVGQTAKALGARSVMITDLSDYRLGIAKEVGIDYTINPTKQTLSVEIANSFGSNNRTNSVRVPMGGGRCESRNADGAVNPYLAAALVLAAGLEGIKEGLDPGKPQEANLYALSDEERENLGIQFLPRTLDEAIQAFAADPFVEEVLGSELRAEFIRYKQAEWNEYHTVVSAWELERYSHLF